MARAKKHDKSVDSIRLPKPLQSWLTCDRCGLAKSRHRVVVGEGDIPADMLIVGEAPGRSENLVGRPFIGPSGRLLSQTMQHAYHSIGVSKPFSYYITNVVACRPCNSGPEPNRTPTQEEMWSCWSRLSTINELVQPRFVILLGSTAGRFCKSFWPHAHHLRHPSWCLRQGGVRSSVWVEYASEWADVLKEEHDRWRK